MGGGFLSGMRGVRTLFVALPMRSILVCDGYMTFVEPRCQTHRLQCCRYNFSCFTCTWPSCMSLSIRLMLDKTTTSSRPIMRRPDRQSMWLSMQPHVLRDRALPRLGLSKDRARVDGWSVCARVRGGPADATLGCLREVAPRTPGLPSRRVRSETQGVAVSCTELKASLPGSSIASDILIGSALDTTSSRATGSPSLAGTLGRRMRTPTDRSERQAGSGGAIHSCHQQGARPPWRIGSPSMRHRSMWAGIGRRLTALAGTPTVAGAW